MGWEGKKVLVPQGNPAAAGLGVHSSLFSIGKKNLKQDTGTRTHTHTQREREREKDVPIFIPSMIGLSPVIAAPIPIPRKAFSQMGVSRSLISPYFL